MQSHYFTNDKATGRTANVELVVSPDGKEAMIRWMFSPEPLRGKGVQKDLVTRICADADAEGATLHVQLLANGESDVARLASFFEVFGFTGSDNLLAPMKREPKAQAAA